MDDELKQKIIRHYFDEYYQKTRSEDKSFSSRLEKFTARHESSLWFAAGLGVTGLAIAAFSVPAIVLIPVFFGGAALVAGIPAFCTRIRENNSCTAHEKIIQDIENGNLVTLYKEQVAKKDPAQKQDLKVLEAGEAAAAFAVASKKEQEDAVAEEAVAEERLKKLKESRPAKPLLKK